VEQSISSKAASKHDDSAGAGPSVLAHPVDRISSPLAVIGTASNPKARVLTEQKPSD